MAPAERTGDDVPGAELAGSNERADGRAGVQEQLDSAVGRRTKILVVDDEARIRRNLVELVRRWGHDCQAAASGAEALRMLEESSWEIVVADIRMPAMDGMELLKEIHRRQSEVDVIMMTAYEMDYSYVDVIDAGATDFLVKPFRKDELQAKVQRIVSERLLKAELVRLSIRDPLTGLFNRRQFFRRLEEEMERARRQHHPLSIVMMDVDGFKSYNDLHGHLQGDAVLSQLSGILHDSLRHHVDSAYRFGGDEFAIILIETTGEQACRVAERVREECEARKLGGCTVTLGVAERMDGDSPEELVNRADQAMYHAKRDGGNSVFCV